MKSRRLYPKFIRFYDLSAGMSSHIFEPPQYSKRRWNIKKEKIINFFYNRSNAYRSTKLERESQIKTNCSFQINQEMQNSSSNLDFKNQQESSKKEDEISFFDDHHTGIFQDFFQNDLESDFDDSICVDDLFEETDI